MNITDEVLMAYADDELDAATRSEVECAIAANSELAKQVDRHRALRTQLSNAFGAVLDETIPEHLKAAVSGQQSSSITNLAQARAAKNTAQQTRRWSPANWMSIAASVTLGVLLGHFVPGEQHRDSIVANAALERALSEQLASNSADSAVQIGVSYLAKSGDYCRSFATAGNDATAGLACRSNNTWQIRMLMPAEKSSGAAYRTAGSTIPAAILDRVNHDINGEPLDAEQEATVVKRGWNAQPR